MIDEPFYMVSEDCFERKEYLGEINSLKLLQMASILSSMPVFNMANWDGDYEYNLNMGKSWLEKNKEFGKNFLPLYQKLISYTGGVEIFLIAMAIIQKQKICESFEMDTDYQQLLIRYKELLTKSQEQYKRNFESQKVV